MSAKPKILISDSLSTQAVQTFEDLGCEVTVSGKLTPEELAHMIPDYDGLAVRFIAFPSTFVFPGLLLIVVSVLT